jgi:hypothetical protein
VQRSGVVDAAERSIDERQRVCVTADQHGVGVAARGRRCDLEHRARDVEPDDERAGCGNGERAHERAGTSTSSWLTRVPRRRDGLRFEMHPVPTNGDVVAILDRIVRRVARRLAADARDDNDADTPPAVLSHVGRSRRNVAITERCQADRSRR